MDKHSLAQVAHWINAPVVKDGVISAFVIDSRKAEPNALFFALKGKKVDGHDFLQQVAEMGAIAAVVSKEYQGSDFGLVLLPVDDVVSAMHQMAKCSFAENKSVVIGITGSVGKTTTKEFLAKLLEAEFVVAKTPGNANSQVGLPLSILNRSGKEQVFVMEMGMSSPHEIEKLVAIAPPEIAVLTKVALAHAANFPDGLEGIAKAKAEILSHPSTQIGIINAQTIGFEPVKTTGGCPRMTYGLKSEFPEADVVLQRTDEGYQIVEQGNLSPLFSLPFTASHLCENFLGAVVACRKMGMSWETIFSQAQHLKVYKNRFEQIQMRGILFLNDSYNANPTSMKAALRNLPVPKEGGKTIAVLGSMRELGEFCESSHRQVAEAASHVVDHLICIGDECKPMVEYFSEKNKSVEWMMSLVDVRLRLFEITTPGDVVLLKGSNSHQLWKLLD